MQVKKLILMILIGSFAKTFIFKDVLSHYKNDIFVCTGVGNGDILIQAITVNYDNGAFSQIYAIEIDPILASHSEKYIIPKCIDYYHLEALKFYCVYNVDSVFNLASIINQIDKPVTFVLASQFPDWINPDKNNFILQELEQIKMHPIKEHTILIDYIYFGNVDIEVIENKLLEINSHYKFKLEDGGHLGREKNAVLVAYF